MITLRTLAALVSSFVAFADTVADIPPRPEEIAFAPLTFEPPEAARFRHTLSNGAVAYLAPSHEFPLVNIVFTFKGGEYLDSPERVGVASMTGAMMRRGGTTNVRPEDLDEQLDFLAANVGVNIAPTQAIASLNCLASNLDEAFGLFLDMLRNPGFDQKRLDVHKGEVIESLKQRNDSADSILAREWRGLLYGRDHFEAAQPTAPAVASMTREDLQAMHARIFHPAAGNLYIAVTGDFNESEMLARLEAALKDWPAGEVPPDPPAPSATFAPGVYHVEKDIPQGKVFIGLRGIRRDDPDAIPMLLMNNILGGGGFTSRITNRVRSDEGLAYSAGSRLTPRVWYPGEFAASFESKSSTCALAIKLILDEIERMRSEPVSPEEIDTAKRAIIETFPRTFESKPTMLGVFVNDEMTGRPKDWWQTFRQRVDAVTADDVQRVAREHLAPADMAIFVVGRWNDIYAGDPEGRASMRDFVGGEVTHLPLRDPLTLEAPRE